VKWKRKTNVTYLKASWPNIFGPFVNLAKWLPARSYRRFEAIRHNSTVKSIQAVFSEREEGIAPEIIESETLRAADKGKYSMCSWQLKSEEHMKYV